MKIRRPNNYPLTPRGSRSEPLRRRPQSLRRSLFSLVSGALALALLLMGVSILRFISETEEQAWGGRQEEAARRAAETVGMFLQRANDLLFLIGSLDHEAPEIEPEIMDELLGQFPALLEVVRLDAGGKVLAQAYRDAPVLSNLFTIPQANWFRQAAQSKAYLGDLQISTGEQPYLIIALPAEDGGVVAGRLNMRLMWDVVPDVGFGQTGRAYVVNRQGQIVAHTDPQVPLSRISIAGRPEMAAIAALESRLPPEHWDGSYVNLEGYAVLAVAAPVPGTHWVVITELTRKEAFTASRAALLLMVAGALLIGALVLLVTQRRLERLIFWPMDSLRQGAERIGQGDLGHRIEIARQDEVGQVGEAFNYMAASLSEQRAALQQSNAQLEALYGISLSLTSNLDLDAVLDSVLRSTFQLLPQLRDAHIFLYQHERLTFAACLWADGRKNEAIAQPRPDGVTYRVARQGETMVVPDIRSHPLFAHVHTGWQGALVSIPLKIGVCVVGVMNMGYAQPRDFADSELRLLRLLGDQVAIAIENARLYGEAQRELVERKAAEQALQKANDELETRVAERTTDLVQRNRQYARLYKQAQQELSARKRAEEALRESEERLRLAKSAARLGVYDYDVAAGTINWDERVRELSGVAPHVTVTYDVFMSGLHPDDRAPTQAAVERALDPRGNGEYCAEYRTIDSADGTERWEAATGRVFFEQGRAVRLVGTVQDITVRKRAEARLAEKTEELARSHAETQSSLQEKVVLLQEIHHRVKNNLQIISSVLNLQAEQIQDREILKVLRESQNRVRSMALIHEKLYQSHNLRRIDLAEYIRELTAFLFKSYRGTADGIGLHIQADQVLLGIDQAVPCGLILNELISNAFKHAFPSHRDWVGKVCVELYPQGDGRLTMVVGDNGVGFPPDFSLANTNSLGLHLVTVLVQQLEGTLDIHGQDGAQFRITFTIH